MAIYYPFIQVLDNQHLKEEAEAVREEEIDFDEFDFNDL